VLFIYGTLKKLWQPRDINNINIKVSTLRENTIISDVCTLFFQIADTLKGQSNEKVCEIRTWDDSFGLNKGLPAVLKKFKIALLKATIF
jgi:hypothetical protein